MFNILSLLVLHACICAAKYRPADMWITQQLLGVGESHANPGLVSTRNKLLTTTSKGAEQDNVASHFYRDLISTLIPMNSPSYQSSDTVAGRPVSQ